MICLVSIENVILNMAQWSGNVNQGNLESFHLSPISVKLSIITMICYATHMVTISINNQYLLSVCDILATV